MKYRLIIDLTTPLVDWHRIERKVSYGWICVTSGYYLEMRKIFDKIKEGCEGIVVEEWDSEPEALPAAPPERVADEPKPLVDSDIPF